jgi:ribosomal protein L16/L10AE
MKKSLLLNKKSHQINIKKIEYNIKKTQILYGYYGIRALSSGFLPVKQIEATRRVISKTTKKFAKL